MKLVHLLLFFPFLCAAQTNSFHKVYGNDAYDYGESIVQLSDSSYVLVGATSSFGSGNTDALMIGIDKNGLLQWQRTFGNQQIEWAEDIILHSNGSLYTVGYTNETNGNGYDILLFKTDQNGTLDWYHKFGGSDWDFAYELIESQDGHILLCGESYSNTNGENDALVLKINALDGELIWEKKYGGTGHDAFYDLTEDFDGNLWFTGYTAQNDSDLYVLKTDASGEELFSQIESIGEHLIGRVIQTHVTGEILLGWDYWKSNAADSIEIAFKKLDTLGNVIWQQANPDDVKSRTSIAITPLENENFILTHRSFLENSSGIWWLISNNGWFIALGGSNSFGNFYDDDFAATIATLDGGVVHVGTTNSWGFGSSSVWVIKMSADFDAPAAPELEYVTTISELEESQFAIFPNPCQKMLSVDLTFEKPAEFLIFDVNGRLTLKGTLSGNINVSSLRKGNYNLVISTDKKVFQKKFLKL